MNSKYTKVTKTKKIDGYDANTRGYIELTTIPHLKIWQVNRYNLDWDVIESQSYQNEYDALTHFNSWD